MMEGFLVVGCILGIVSVICTCILKYQRVEYDHKIAMAREEADREKAE